MAFFYCLVFSAVPKYSPFAFLRLLFVLFFLAIAGDAKALYLFQAGGNTLVSDPLTACQMKAVGPAYGGVQYVSTQQRTSSPNIFNCMALSVKGELYNAYSLNVTRIQVTDCATGEEWSDAAQSCQSIEDPCELLADMCSGSQGKTSAFSLSGKKTGVSFTCMSPLSFGGEPLPGCTKGCMAQVGGFTTAFQSDDGSWMTQGTAKYSGSTCDPSVINDLNSEADPEYEPEENPETSNPPDPSCPGGFKGTVNGVSVCVPPKGSSGVTELEEKDNGDGTKTNTKTEVKCENGKCEITKTSTTTNTTTNSTVSSSSTTTTVDKADYCSKNSSAGVCKNENGEEEGKGSFGGSCQAGFTCKGDAAMCAMAKEQHKRNCETLEEDKDPASFINQVKNGTDSQSAKAMQESASEIHITTQLDKSGYGWSRSCPSNTRIELGFVNAAFEIPFDKLCGPLKIFSDIALAITALSLLVWLVFAGREKAGS